MWEQLCFYKPRGWIFLPIFICRKGLFYLIIREKGQNTQGFAVGQPPRTDSAQNIPEQASGGAAIAREVVF